MTIDLDTIRAHVNKCIAGVTADLELWTALKNALAELQARRAADLTPPKPGTKPTVSGGESGRLQTP